MRIAVAGGTGVVGRHVDEVARARGHETVLLARSTGVDLVSGRGLPERLAGVDVVVDTTSTRSQDATANRDFCRAVTTHLLDAGRATGVPHHIALSVVGSDVLGSPHYLGKRVQEQLISASGTGWTIQRATQFHEFAEQALGFARLGPVSLVPRMRCQPVAAVEVAARLVDLAEGGPLGRAPELAGPREELLVDMARRYVARRRLRRLVVPVPLPGAGRSTRDALLPRHPGPRGSTTFQQWLDALDVPTS